MDLLCSRESSPSTEGDSDLGERPRKRRKKKSPVPSSKAKRSNTMGVWTGERQPGHIIPNHLLAEILDFAAGPETVVALAQGTVSPIFDHLLVLKTKTCSWALHQAITRGKDPRFRDYPAGAFDTVELTNQRFETDFPLYVDVNLGHQAFNKLSTVRVEGGLWALENPPKTLSTLVSCGKNGSITHKGTKLPNLQTVEARSGGTVNLYTLNNASFPKLGTVLVEGADSRVDLQARVLPFLKLVSVIGKNAELWLSGANAPRIDNFTAGPNTLVRMEQASMPVNGIKTTRIHKKARLRGCTRAELKRGVVFG